MPSATSSTTPVPVPAHPAEPPKPVKANALQPAAASVPAPAGSWATPPIGAALPALFGGAALIGKPCEAGMQLAASSWQPFGWMLRF